LGKQVFELSNHLGNQHVPTQSGVLATITDKKLQVSLNTTSTAYFEADVQTVQDYYAFGMQMPGRKLSGGYRFGFNGKENDNEVKGEGNQQDYGMRIYDGRIGKFLSVDPITNKYPFLTPYQFSSNNPVLCIDIDGLEGDPFSIGRAVSSNREWEANLRKTDPQNAEKKIYEANKQAFMVVGGMLSGGSARLATLFTDLFLLDGANDVRKGIQRKDAEQVNDGIRTMAWGIGTEFFALSVSKFAPYLYKPLSDGVTKLLQRATIVNASTKAALNSVKNQAGVYVHEFQSGTVYVGQTVNLGSRPTESLKELIDVTGKFKGTAAKAGDTYSGTTRLIKLEGSGYNTLNELESAVLNKGFEGTMKEGGKTYNIRKIPNDK
jgi:RHS repeat-associated protein